MKHSGPEQRLAAGLAELGVPATARQQESLLRYLEELLRWNRRINLTAIRDAETAVVKHLLDSAAVLRYARPGPLLDVGSGAGLPAVVLAILDPALAVTALDSRQRRIAFQQHVAGRLGLDNLDPVCARVEEFRPAAPFPRIISRAFAALRDFADLSGGLLAAGGELLAMKGQRPDEELAIVAADWEVATIDRLSIPGLAEQRHMIVLRRPGPTSNQAGA